MDHDASQGPEGQRADEAARCKSNSFAVGGCKFTKGIHSFVKALRPRLCLVRSS